MPFSLTWRKRIERVCGSCKKIIWFIENSDQIEKMGIESRKMAEDKFDVHKVNEEMLKIMEIT